MKNQLLYSLNKVKHFYSFLPDKKNTGYTLLDVEESIIDEFKSHVKNLLLNNNLYLTARGDHKKPLDHSEFFDEKLSYFFIVGEKARTHLTETKSIFKQSNCKTNTIHEISEIIENCNQMLYKWNKRYTKIDGRLEDTLLQSILKKSREEQEKVKLILLSLLHNKGLDHNFKYASPFISLTYGEKIIPTARKFATSKINNGEKGIIYLYILNKRFCNFFKADELKDFLKKFGVNWFDDDNKEIMLLNGMYPHYFLGLFEITKTTYPRFIINPWINLKLLTGDMCDFSNGVPVNQKNFGEFAQKLEYISYVYHYFGKYNESISRIGHHDDNQVYPMR